MRRDTGSTFPAIMAHSVFAPPASFSAPFDEYDGTDGTVRVGEKLWAKLSKGSDSQRIGIAIQPLTRRAESKLPSLVSWAEFDPSVRFIHSRLPIL